MPLVFYSMVALVQEFLPPMLARGDGAILTAQGASTVHGLPNMSGPGPAQAAQRNYLRSLHTRWPPRASTWHALRRRDHRRQRLLRLAPERQGDRRRNPGLGPDRHPAHLADILRDMHKVKARQKSSTPPAIYLRAVTATDNARLDPVLTGCPGNLAAASSRQGTYHPLRALRRRPPTSVGSSNGENKSVSASQPARAPAPGAFPQAGPLVRPVIERGRAHHHIERRFGEEMAAPPPSPPASAGGPVRRRGPGGRDHR